MEERRSYLLEQLRQFQQLAAEVPASAAQLRKWVAAGPRTGDFLGRGPIVGYTVSVVEVDRRFRDDDVRQPGPDDLQNEVEYATATAEETVDLFEKLTGDLSLVKPWRETDCPI